MANLLFDLIYKFTVRQHKMYTEDKVREGYHIKWIFSAVIRERMVHSISKKPQEQQYQMKYRKTDAHFLLTITKNTYTCKNKRHRRDPFCTPNSEWVQEMSSCVHRCFIFFPQISLQCDQPWEAALVCYIGLHIFEFFCKLISAYLLRLHLPLIDHLWFQFILLQPLLSSCSCTLGAFDKIGGAGFSSTQDITSW